MVGSGSGFSKSRTVSNAGPRLRLYNNQKIKTSSLASKASLRAVRNVKNVQNVGAQLPTLFVKIVYCKLFLKRARVALLEPTQRFGSGFFRQMCANAMIKIGI